MSNPSRKNNPHFFSRTDDGSVRVRVRFENDEASLFEEAAGDTPVMLWLHRTLIAAAKRQIREQRSQRTQIPPLE